MYTPFAHAFAYAIKQTPYAFVAKIILCMYLLYGRMNHLDEQLQLRTDLYRVHWIRRATNPR